MCCGIKEGISSPLGSHWVNAYKLSQNGFSDLIGSRNQIAGKFRDELGLFILPPLRWHRCVFRFEVCPERLHRDLTQKIANTEGHPPDLQYSSISATVFELRVLRGWPRH